MKKIKYDDIVDINKIISIYNKIIINTKHRNKILDYNLFYMSNLVNIYNNLLGRTYNHGKYNIFLIKEPKPRVIMSEKLNDKIVNHLLSDYVLVPLIEPKLIDMNVATRINRGTKKAIDYMKKYLRIMKNKYDDFYILKCDISKFFYNIDHEILLNKLSKVILDKDLYLLITNIIKSTDMDYVNTQISNLKNYYNIEVPLYRKGKGLPIGNQTSQVLAIFYLNDLDHFIKEQLHIKYYVRYMDDFILIHQDKAYLKYCLYMINSFLTKEKLVLNRKTSISSISNGINFIGYRYIFKNNKLIMLIPSSNKRRIKKRINNRNTCIPNYHGYLKFGNTRNFCIKKQLKINNINRSRLIQ